MQLNQKMREQLLTDGYIVVDDVLSQSEMQRLKSLTLPFVVKNGIVLDGGYCQPDALSKLPELVDVLFNPNFIDTLRFLCGPEILYAHHSDIQYNRYTGWHKDARGHNDYAIDDKGNGYSVYKVAVYLQDHSNDSTALAVTKGSHLEKNINKSGEYLHPKLGSIIIFDQRISHNGVAALIPSKILLRLIKNNRIQMKWWNIERKIRGLQDKLFIQIAFGKNDDFTKEHVDVAVKRQIEQNNDPYYHLPKPLADRFNKLNIKSYPLNDVAVK